MKFRRTALEAFKWCAVLYLLTDIWLAFTDGIHWPEAIFVFGLGPLLALCHLFEDQLWALGFMHSGGWFAWPTAGGLILVAAVAYSVVFLAVWLFGGRRK